VEVACFRRGLLTLRAGDATVRISPPLVLGEQQAKTGLRIFEEACAEVARAGPGAFAPAAGSPEAGGTVPEGA
jgi:4-aminobutyrate aminotransferase